jgi:hypothetical protein
MTSSGCASFVYAESRSGSITRSRSSTNFGARRLRIESTTSASDDRAHFASRLPVAVADLCLSYLGVVDLTYLRVTALGQMTVVTGYFRRAAALHHIAPPTTSIGTIAPLPPPGMPFVGMPFVGMPFVGMPLVGMPFVGFSTADRVGFGVMCLYAQKLRHVEVRGSWLRTEDTRAFSALVGRNAATLRVARYDTVLASVELWSALRLCVHLEEFDSSISNCATADSSDLYKDLTEIRATCVIDILKECRHLRVLDVQRLDTTVQMNLWQRSLADALRHLSLSVFRIQDPSVACLQLLGREPIHQSLTELHIALPCEGGRSFGAICDTLATQLPQLKNLLSLTVDAWASAERSDNVWKSDSVTFLKLCGRSDIPEQWPRISMSRLMRFLGIGNLFLIVNVLRGAPLLRDLVYKFQNDVIIDASPAEFRDAIKHSSRHLQTLQIQWIPLHGSVLCAMANAWTNLVDVRLEVHSNPTMLRSVIALLGALAPDAHTFQLAQNTEPEEEYIDDDGDDGTYDDADDERSRDEIKHSTQASTSGSDVVTTSESDAVTTSSPHSLRPVTRRTTSLTDHIILAHMTSFRLPAALWGGTMFRLLRLPLLDRLLCNDEEDSKLSDTVVALQHLVAHLERCTHLTIDLAPLLNQLSSLHNSDTSPERKNTITHLTLLFADECDFAPLMCYWPSLTVLELQIVQCSPDSLASVLKNLCALKTTAVATNIVTLHLRESDSFARHQTDLNESATRTFLLQIVSIMPRLAHIQLQFPKTQIISNDLQTELQNILSSRQTPLSSFLFFV